MRVLISGFVTALLALSVSTAVGSIETLAWPLAPYSGQGCSGAVYGLSGCTDGSSVTITESRESSSGDDYSGGGSADGTSAGSSPDDDSLHCIRIENDRCLAPGPGRNSSTGAPPTITTITSTDLAAFAPASAAIRMEPDGWALLHRPTNFWIDATAHSQHGTLFGRPVTVEFTPHRVHWDYGDGTTATTDTLGASWRTLRAPELSTTATSHTYTERGTYTVTATIHYSATVTVDGRSIRVDGELTNTASTAPFQLYEANSVLVPNHP